MLAVGLRIGVQRRQSVQPVTKRSNSPMTSQQRRNNNEAQRWDSLPGPVCQQPDKDGPRACAMQQLAGHQRKPMGAFKNKPNARVLLEAGVRLDQPDMIPA